MRYTLNLGYGMNFHPAMPCVYFVSLWVATHLLENVRLVRLLHDLHAFGLDLKKKLFGVPLRPTGFIEFVRSQKSECRASHIQSKLGHVDTCPSLDIFVTNLSGVHLPLRSAPHNMASDQSLHCLLTGFSIKIRIKATK